MAMKQDVPQDRTEPVTRQQREAAKRRLEQTGRIMETLKLLTFFTKWEVYDNAIVVRVLNQPYAEDQAFVIRTNFHEGENPYYSEEEEEF